MQIAIDASRTTVAHRTGTENYALQLIRALLAVRPPHDIHLYFRDQPPPDLFWDYDNVTQHIIPQRHAWTHTRFAYAMWRARPDVVWVPAHTLPVFFPGKAVVTVHDLGYRYFPQAHPRAERLYLETTTRFSAWRASQIMADSKATRRDLIQIYKVQPSKIYVVHPGVDDHLHHIHDTAAQRAVRKRYKLPERYLLFLGTLQPRKNIARLVEAFRQWQQNSTQQDVVLALGGKPGRLYDANWTHEVKNVSLLGYVADEDLSALYSGALGFVFPSLFEGFGFPVLEAMRCGTPVLCSDTSSLAEVGGDAAVKVDPLRIESISDGIRQLVEDRALRDDLIQKGYHHAAQFTWGRAAMQALSVLEVAAR